MSDDLGRHMIRLFTLYEISCGIARREPPEPETTPCVVGGCNQYATVTVKVGELDPISICDTHLARLDRLHERVRRKLDEDPKGGLAQLAFDFDR